MRRVITYELMTEFSASLLVRRRPKLFDPEAMLAGVICDFVQLLSRNQAAHDSSRGVISQFTWRQVSFHANASAFIVKI